MSETKVDWSKAPEGAEFFSAYYFRKHVDGVEYAYKDDKWVIVEPSEAIHIHVMRYDDFEVRPASVVKDPVCTPEATPDVATGAIKSSGGSSSYYDIEIPDWLFDKIYERRYSENCYIKTEELIEVLGDSFNQGTILKSLVRLNSLLNGVGKAGNTVDYECNKIIYYANRIKEEQSR